LLLNFKILIMKKILLFSLTMALGYSGFTQNATILDLKGTTIGTTSDLRQITPVDPSTNPGTDKTTVVSGDTTGLFGGNFDRAIPDSCWRLMVGSQPFDSGFVFGISAWGYEGYAMLYPYREVNRDNTKDTTYELVGVLSLWGGTRQTTSTKKIKFSAWSRTTTKVPYPNRATWSIYGLPGSTIVSKEINATDMAGQTVVWFPKPYKKISEDIYLGAEIDYTWGSLAADTFGLMNTRPTYTLNTMRPESTTADTVINVMNIIKNSGGTWGATFASLGRPVGDIAIIPLIHRECPTCWTNSVTGGFSDRNLTFHGAYPNPAVNSTNVVFTLKEVADVTITVMDVTGKTINTIVNNNMSAGKNEVRIETSQLAAGNYIYSIQNNKGGAVASQFTVAK
jgi:hypothetical protein